MTLPVKNLSFIMRVSGDLATPDVKTPLIFIYLESNPQSSLKTPAPTCKSSLPASDMLLHDSTELLYEVPSPHGPHPEGWQKE